MSTTAQKFGRDSTGLGSFDFPLTKSVFFNADAATSHTVAIPALTNKIVVIPAIGQSVIISKVDISGDIPTVGNQATIVADQITSPFNLTWEGETTLQLFASVAGLVQLKVFGNSID